MKKSKKDQIIEKATELFFEKGILATSMDEIAEMTPVAKMTIYKYFHNKEGLLSEVLNRYVREKHMFMSDQIQRYPDPLDAILHIMNYKDMDIPQQFLKECFENYPQFVVEMMTYYKENIAKEFEKLILNAQQKGQIRKELSPHILMIYVQAIKEHLAKPEVVKGIADLRTVGEQFISMFLYGIVTPEHQGK